MVAGSGANRAATGRSSPVGRATKRRLTFGSYCFVGNMLLKGGCRSFQEARVQDSGQGRRHPRAGFLAFDDDEAVIGVRILSESAAIDISGDLGVTTKLLCVSHRTLRGRLYLRFTALVLFTELSSEVAELL